MKNYIKTLAIAALLLVSSVVTYAGISSTNQVTLAWDASVAPGITNYTVYSWVGTTTNTVNAGTSLTATVGNLTSGVTYSFAASATDNTGLESVLSTSITYVPPFVKPAPPSNLRKIAP